MVVNSLTFVHHLSINLFALICNFPLCPTIVYIGAATVVYKLLNVTIKLLEVCPYILFSYFFREAL